MPGGGIRELKEVWGKGVDCWLCGRDRKMEGLGEVMGKNIRGRKTRKTKAEKRDEGVGCKNREDC